MQDLGRLFFPKKYVGGCHFIKQVQEKQTENSFREVVSTREVNREKCIFWAQNFSGALRNTWKIFRGLYGSVFEPEQFLGLLRNARLVTTVGLTEPDGGSWFRESVTGSACLGWPARLFWTGWPVSWGLIGSAAAGAGFDGLSCDGRTKLVSEVWTNGSLDWRRCLQFLLYSLPSSVLRKNGYQPGLLLVP